MCPYCLKDVETIVGIVGRKFQVRSDNISRNNLYDSVLVYIEKLDHHKVSERLCECV